MSEKNKMYSLESFRENIKKIRHSEFIKPYDLIYACFEKLGYDKQPKEFFFENASKIVESLRNESWNAFVPKERSFTSSMLEKLIDKEKILKLDPVEAIENFIQTYPEHIYALILSNTQSRRSRAGKEFEAIIELLFIGSGLAFDSQGNIGKHVFMDKGLGKLVDVVAPGVIEYEINKRNSVLISAKTTLRERWQEVPEEMGRTGARDMFLATLDESISDEVLDTLYESNINIVTTKHLKSTKYKSSPRVLNFEEMLAIIRSNNSFWDTYTYSNVQLKQKSEEIRRQIEKHREQPAVYEYFCSSLKSLGLPDNYLSDSPDTLL